MSYQNVFNQNFGAEIGNMFDTSNIGNGQIGRSVPSNGCMVEIVSLHLQDTGTYNDMFHYEYQAMMPDDSVNTMIGAMERNNLATNGQVFSSIASDLIDINLRNGNNAVIPNGWGTKRLRFLLQTRERFPKFPHITFYSYLQGFTDFLDVSLQNKQLNPDTTFFINSFIRISEQTVQSADGPRLVHRIDSKGQLVNGILVRNQNPTGTTHFLRPMDIYGKVQILNDQEMVSNDVLDLRGSTIAGSQSVLNNFMNNTPTHYLSRLMTPIAESLKQVNYSHAGNVVDNAVGNAIAQEPSPSDNPVVNLIERQLGRAGAPYFTVKELEYMDASVGQRVHYIPVADSYSTGLSRRGIGENWNNALPETSLAIKLLNAIPGVMWSNYIGVACFSITNRFGSNSCELKMDAVRSLTVYTPLEAVNNFMTELQQVIARDISYNHKILFDANISVSILGDIQMNISVNGSTPLLYIAPVFSSGVLNPVYTHDQTNFNAFANKMHSIVSGLESICRSTETSFLNMGI